MNRPLFSIIIPVYNVAPYLRECLDSVLAQTCADWEAICVDDGSTDGSGAILDEYAKNDSRIHVIHQSNAGPGSARNVGLNLATGEWISFVDADDTVAPDYLSSFESIVEKADVNFFSAQYIYNDGSCKVVSANSHGIVTGARKLYDYLALMAWNKAGVHYLGFSVNKFYRASVIRKNNVRFSETLRICEDEVFLFKCLEYVESIRVDERAPYNYYWREKGLSCQEMPPFLDAAQEYQEISRATKHNYIRALAEQRVAECCTWKMGGPLTFGDVRRIMSLMQHQFKVGTNSFSRGISMINRISPTLAALICRAYIRHARLPGVSIDWRSQVYNAEHCYA